MTVKHKRTSDPAVRERKPREPDETVVNQGSSAPSTSSPKGPLLPVAAKIFAAVATIGGLSLHLMGYVTHRTYLKSLGVDPGLFPKSTDWLVINGYYTLADRFLLIFKAASVNWWKILLAMLGVAVYTFLVQQLGKSIGTASPPAWLQRQWLRDLLQNLFASGLLFIVVPWTVVVSMLLIFLPAVLGESAGNDAAVKDLEKYRKGCLVTPTCTELRRDGKLLATGFLIDSSESHLAIYDTALGRSHAFERSGTDFVGPPPDMGTVSKATASKP